MNVINDIIYELLEEIGEVCELLEKRENKLGYEKMPFIINKLTSVMIQVLRSGEFNQKKILEPLKDMMLAMENKDQVLLLDTLQFGITMVLKAVIIEDNREN